MSLTGVAALAPVVWKINMLVMRFKWVGTMANKAEKDKTIITHECNLDNLKERAPT